MSEFIAEAQVLVVPDTKGFRASLERQLLAATKGITIPVGFSAAGTSAQQVGGALDTLNKKSKVATASFSDLSRSTSNLNAGLLGLRTAIGSSAVIGLGAMSLAAIGAGQALRTSIQSFASFEQELATFRVTAGASADEIRAVSDRAKALGEDVRLPAVSAADAAVAMTELAKAGLSVEDAMAGAEGVLQLATAAQISNAEAAQIAANALNSFGLAGDQAARVADDFANAANAAQGSIADIGIALQQSSAVARQVGLSLEDTTAILSLFAKNGLQGSDAGTSLRVALIRLVAPTEQAAAEIKKLGLNIRDANGNVRADVFAQFGQATADLAPAARDAAAALIFGQDAIRAVAIGAREGASGLQLMQFQIDQQGTAAELAAARTEGLAGTLEALKNEVAGVGISLGQSLAPALEATIAVFEPWIKIVGFATEAVIKFEEQVARLKGPAEDTGNAIENTTGRVGTFLDRVTKGVPGLDQFFDPAFGKAADDQGKSLKALTDQLQALQKVRIDAKTAGATAFVDELTKNIDDLKQQIAVLEAAGRSVPGSVVEPLQQSIAVLEDLKSSAAPKDVPFIQALIDAARKSIPVVQEAGREMANMTRGMDGVKFAAFGAAGGVASLSAALKGLKRDSSAAQAELLRLQTEGGTPAQQVGVLQSDIETQRDIIRQRQLHGNQPGDASAIQKAREQIKSDQSQIDSIQAGIVSDQKKAADEAKRKAKDAQEERDKQFEALADTFGGRQTDIENAIERAGINDNVARQIKLNQALIAALNKERAALLARLKTLKVSADLRKKILQAINAALEEARQDAIRLQKEQQEKINDAINTRLDLRIQLAEARDDVAAQIKARRAKLAQITAELARLKNAHKKNTNAWLQLKVAQAEEIAAIKELEGQTKEKESSQKGLFFQFLQTQQGFAANLLGNLIPGFATKGLVGGSGDTGAGGEGLRQVPGGFEQPRGAAASSAALASSRDRGVRPIQVDTTNAILRRILAALTNLNGRAAHPEARYQKQASGGMMDTL